MRMARQRTARSPPWNCSPPWLKPSAATSSSGRSSPAKTELWPPEAWFAFFSQTRCHGGGAQVDNSPSTGTSLISTFLLPHTRTIRVKQAETALRAFSVVNWTGALQTDTHKLHVLLLVVFLFKKCYFMNLNFNLFIMPLFLLLLFEVKLILDTELFVIFSSANAMNFPTWHFQVPLCSFWTRSVGQTENNQLSCCPLTCQTGLIMCGSKSCAILDESQIIFHVVFCFHPLRTWLLIVCKTNWIDCQLSLGQDR